jgi:hypothetical protein
MFPFHVCTLSPILIKSPSKPPYFIPFPLIGCDNTFSEARFKNPRGEVHSKRMAYYPEKTIGNIRTQGTQRKTGKLALVSFSPLR